MDQNHAPPSPLQQHRHSSSRHANQGSASTQSSSSIDNKLKNPVGLGRQGTTTTCASPTSAQTNLTQWSGAQEPSSSATSLPQTTTSMSWSQESEEAAVERWRAQNQSTSSTLTTSTSSWEHNTNTQPLASSSRCPSPHHISIELSDTTIQSHSPRPYPTDAPSSSLLTSEPLNRTASANASPTMHTPEPSPPRRKRHRACSLPTATPIFKRRKSRHDTPTPSEIWQRTYETGRTSPTKIQRQKAAAAELGRVLRSNRQIKAVATTQEQHCVVACRQPAINVSSLRTLDATEILKNPQLRHDLLFDSLAFRPVNLPYEVPSKPGYAEIVTGGKTPVVDPRASSFVADMYWDSIAEELSTGCRCVRWSMPKNQTKLVGRMVEKLERIPQCLCGRWRRDLTENEWWSRAAVWPSRLPELIRTLREILVSLMGSTTPCPNHFAHSFSKEALEAHEAVCPTVTHALVPELYAALDPEFLTIQARRGVFDLHLFEKLGEAMKVHCAPVRDEVVDDMVRTALSGDVAKGLRKCFDCAEVMKLDIANHQVHALRPYLWDNANQHEYSAFQSILAHNSTTPENSITRQWINSASRKVLFAAEPRIRPHLIGKCDCKNNKELVIRSLATGFIELVFEQWDSEKSIWPPTVTKRVIGSNGIPVLDSIHKSSIKIPESFKMDTRRIRDFHSEVIDIAISHMVLLAFRDLFNQHNGKVSPEVLQSVLKKARSDIEWTTDQLSTISKKSEESITTTEEQKLKSDLAFILALRIVRPNSGLTDEINNLPNQEEMKIVSKIASTLTTYLNVNLTQDSNLLKGNMKRLKIFLIEKISNILLSYRLNPTSTFYDQKVDKCLKRSYELSPSSSSSNNKDIEMFDQQQQEKLENKTNSSSSSSREIREKYEIFLIKSKNSENEFIKLNGMEGIIEPIKELSNRMIKIIAFNLSVFGEIYAGQGMIIGSG
ncbi:uncharacterized protein I206_101457 [Kwoniella pini CBS 10737]|uniref:Uncharacterized protein n=1 Tax=Kwoniella pini CBS 10737 TaxID=1296096 RepID=A0A1B9HWL3_9TREE|nr:uncharacterized protein I206_06571 [Kwoniella pini CBS 10737]OCF47666.1 hypothetical protein I206_06571 [Kwoniella pini CBS 10737]